MQASRTPRNQSRSATAPHSPRPRRRCTGLEVTATSRTDGLALVQAKRMPPVRSQAHRATGQTRESSADAARSGTTTKSSP